MVPVGEQVARSDEYPERKILESRLTGSIDRANAVVGELPALVGTIPNLRKAVRRSARYLAARGYDPAPADTLAVELDRLAVVDEP